MHALERIKCNRKLYAERVGGHGHVNASSFFGVADTISMLLCQRLLVLRKVWPAVDRGHLLRMIAISPKILAKIRKTSCMMGWLAEWLVLHLIELNIRRPSLCSARGRWIQKRGNVVNGSIRRRSLLQEVCGRYLCGRGRMQGRSGLRYTVTWRYSCGPAPLWAMSARSLLCVRLPILLNWSRGGDGLSLAICVRAGH